ncbi:14792_t:CDS:2 [Acaulospora morrowiae]|uniref:14792_t:CDS:1 n=1 Tax=Acaulospora morrowiae TaxID=94023 RepID=A0A9N9E691_9GLOM|nr:14792_t:CDS:2 [Acaulospora morrowiae]
MLAEQAPALIPLSRPLMSFQKECQSTIIIEPCGGKKATLIQRQNGKKKPMKCGPVYGTDGSILPLCAIRTRADDSGKEGDASFRPEKPRGEPWPNIVTEVAYSESELHVLEKVKDFWLHNWSRCHEVIVVKIDKPPEEDQAPLRMQGQSQKIIGYPDSDLYDELETRVSDSSLRELNSGLVTEIDKLRREKDSLIGKNTELLARVVELEQTIKEDAQNTKLRDAELNTRILELQNRVVKLEQNQCIDTNANSLDYETSSNGTSEQIISCNEKSNTSSHEVTGFSNSDIYQDSVTSPAETISFDSQNEFLDSKHRETVRKEIIQNIKKKKLRDQELLSTPENTIPKISISPNKNVSIPEAEKSLLNKDLNIQDTKISSSESKSSIISSSNQEQSAISSKTKIPYNQKVEKGLICKLSTFINEKSLSNSIPDRQILENMLGGDDSTPGSALHLAHLFDKAKKTGQKEVLL